MVQKLGLKKLTGTLPLTGSNTSSAAKLVVMLKPVTMANSHLLQFTVLVIWPLSRDPNTLIMQYLTGSKDFLFELTSFNRISFTFYIISSE